MKESKNSNPQGLKKSSFQAALKSHLSFIFYIILPYLFFRKNCYSSVQNCWVQRSTDSCTKEILKFTKLGFPQILHTLTHQ